jgi:hypothetical protein
MLPPPDETATTESPDAAMDAGSVGLALNLQDPFLPTTALPICGPSNAPRWSVMVPPTVEARPLTTQSPFREVNLAVRIETVSL